MANIGVGVTTYNRPDCISECLTHILEYTRLEAVYIGGNVKLHIARDTDEDRRGVAYRKNECLRALKNCDYVFLFDDDCFPIKHNWVDFFIHASIFTKNEHFLYLNSSHKKQGAIHTNDNLPQIDIYKDCGGVFMFMTKSAIDRVGAFDESYGLYGFEHADYSNRILDKRGEYPCLADTDKYIFAHDYSLKIHASTITPLERFNFVEKNKNKYWNEEIKSIYLPL
jgi:GT2 family glycosyltransferase